ncbi:unnamed protein product [Ostreobium quekettii]|uniref:Uncharacterized protein n=1 Tax=Ostreobium quekettii TaxID=121088 RepID=A0A8S1IK26_9CHLO|nr:unnamed protein product [Ostreobium quekettii]
MCSGLLFHLCATRWWTTSPPTCYIPANGWHWHRIHNFMMCALLSVWYTHVIVGSATSPVLGFVLEMMHKCSWMCCLQLNAFLAPRVFLVGTSLTLADICIFVVVHKAVTGFPVAQTKRFCNLLRWHDLMLNIAEWSGIIATVPLRKPVFDFTPPQPPPPQPKAPKTDPGQAQQADSKASSKAESKAAKKSSAVEATKT